MKYLQPRTNSPAERALCFAENACRVPLGDEVSRFKVMEWTAAAVEELGRVWCDDITAEIVCDKIGEAQRRAGV